MNAENTRIPADLSPNRWARILHEVRDAARAAGTPIFDLTISNPTTAGFRWPREVLAAALSAGEIENYAPSPRGNAAARRAVADFYKKEHSTDVDPARIFITASTSESYSRLAKLLCAAGNNVLAPAPSYPLIEHLCRLENVDPRAYFLKFDERAAHWTPDFAALERAIDARTRAIFCVSPNNPTGSVFSADERAKLLALARERALTLVVDEVFAEYPRGNGGNCDCAGAPANAASFAGTRDAPVFVLGGLSKTAALPQIKIGWIVACGDAHFLEKTLPRLDFIADAFLSAAEPSQCAVPALLAASGAMRKRICARLDANETLLKNWAQASPHGVKILPRQAGWSAVLRLPRGVNEDALCIDLLRRESVVAHPGRFYDLDLVPAEIFSANSVPAPHLVISLLTPPEILTAALPRLDSALLRN